MKNNKIHKNSFPNEKWENGGHKKTIKKSRFINEEEYDDWRSKDFRPKLQSFERSKY